MRRTLSVVVTVAILALSFGVPAGARTSSSEGAAPLAASERSALIQLAIANVGIDKDGLFVVRADAPRAVAARLRAVFDPLNARLVAVDRSLRPTLEPRLGRVAGVAAPLQLFCGYVPKWAFQAFAWSVILTGGIFATVGLFASGTIFGLPAGIVLGAAGIWIGMTGGAMLWFVDNYMPPQGVYVCV